MGSRLLSLHLHFYHRVPLPSKKPLIYLTPLIKYLRGGISTGNEVLSTSQFIVFPFPSVNCLSLPLCRWVTLSRIKISKWKFPLYFVIIYLYQMLDKRSGSWGRGAMPPPRPVKISHKKKNAFQQDAYHPLVVRWGLVGGGGGRPHQLHCI